MPTHDDEKDSENSEAHQLDGLASPRVDENKCYPIARDEATRGKDDIANRDIVKRLIYAERALLG